MNTNKDFPLQKGLDIQAQQLADWKPKLAPKLFEDLVAYASTDKENWSDGFDVKRGVTLSNFIANWDEKPNFNLIDELNALSQELDGQEINGLIFVGAQVDGGAWHLSFKGNIHSMKAVNIFCTPFAGVDGIQFMIGNQRILVSCKRPTSYEEFDSWKKFYIGQLTVVQGKFATVTSVVVNNDIRNIKLEKTITVEGFLVPKQTVKFEEFDEWGSLVDYNSNPIVDWHLNLDEKFNFEIVDYNFVIDVKEGESKINLDDTADWGETTHTCRDYRDCGVVKLVDNIHPLTARILDQFYVKYAQSNEDGDVETRINLDAIVNSYFN